MVNNFVLTVSQKQCQIHCAAPTEILTNLCYKLRKECSPSRGHQGKAEEEGVGDVSVEGNRRPVGLVHWVLFLLSCAKCSYSNLFFYLIKAFGFIKPFTQKLVMTPNCYFWSAFVNGVCDSSSALGCSSSCLPSLFFRETFLVVL